MGRKKIIRAEDITKIYPMGDLDVVALDGVNLEIYTGEFIAIMGPSGSGKSTLMNILGCLDRPTSGRYILDKEDISNLDRTQLAAIRNHQIGFVFQSYNLLPRTSALENVLVPLDYDRRSERTEEENITLARKTLESVGLSDRMDHMPHELSGGQQQRVAIARAMVNDPALIFADEPTGNLDSRAGNEIMELLDNLHQRGRTIVMVTHEPGVAEFAERVIRFHDGVIVSDENNGNRKKIKGKL